MSSFNFNCGVRALIHLLGKEKRNISCLASILIPETVNFPLHFTEQISQIISLMAT